MSENRCVVCGEIVPEGRMVCPNCSADLGKNTLMTRFYGLYTPLTFEPSLTKDACPMCRRPFDKDFVKVVRCKDCKWAEWDAPNESLACYEPHYKLVDDDFFCRYGRKKEEKTDG